MVDIPVSSLRPSHVTGDTKTQLISKHTRVYQTSGNVFPQVDLQLVECLIGLNATDHDSTQGIPRVDRDSRRCCGCDLHYSPACMSYESQMQYCCICLIGVFVSPGVCHYCCAIFGANALLNVKASMPPPCLPTYAHEPKNHRALRYKYRSFR